MPSLSLSTLTLTVLTACTLAHTPAADAEELFALAGLTDSSGSAGTYGWQMSFQKALSSRFEASLSWINEGHFALHSRDGAAAQLWVNGARWWQGRLGLDLGVGPYLWFDTQPSSAVRAYSDVHGAAGILSASLSLAASRSLLVSLRANQILSSDNITTFALLLGVGYRFDGPVGKIALTGADTAPSESGPQLQLFGGRTIMNDLSARKSGAIGVDYRVPVARWAAWSATWFDNLGSGPGIKDRLASQLWLLDRPLGHALTFSVGVGPYVILGALPAGSATSARLSGLSGLRVDWQVARHLSVIATWYRTFTEDDRDRDIITAGVGWLFGRP